MSIPTRGRPSEAATESDHRPEDQVGRPYPSIPQQTILVVDDESSLRELIVRSLKSEGYGVMEAGDGLEALETIDLGDSVALVICDINMPRMDGYKLADRLALRPDATPMIFISGYDQGGIALSGSIFSKPFSMEALLGEIHRMLGRQPQPE